MLEDARKKVEDAKKKIDEKFVKSEITKVEDGDLDVVMDNKDEIDKKLSGYGMKKYAELGKIMFGMLKDYKKGEYTIVPWFIIAATGFALLYVFNPMDIVPDFIPGVGYVDDFAILTIVLRFIQTDLHTYLDWKIDRAKNA
ncbi:YkvA family protein [Salinimicrobium soli]|uniref:YkvA family protein n=1 Tax=Salinimicrobium soli TaxID=1254399 RepID=UPI003AAAF281